MGGSAAQSMVFRIRVTSEVREERLAAHGDQVQLAVAQRLAVGLQRLGALIGRCRWKFAVCGGYAAGAGNTRQLRMARVGRATHGVFTDIRVVPQELMCKDAGAFDEPCTACLAAKNDLFPTEHAHPLELLAVGISVALLGGALRPRAIAALWDSPYLP